MTTYTCTPERFAGDVRDHAMTVLRANGIDRHLRFRKPGCSAYWFDILSWPGALCIDGDCGTFVFRREADMFGFFRNGRDGINPRYWSEKVVSGGKNIGGGIEEYDAGKFRAELVRQYREHYRHTGLYREALEGFRTLRDDVLSRVEEGAQIACHAVYDFEVNGHQVFDEISARWYSEYTFHFIWCLRAIVWAIQQWDASLQEKAA